MPEHLSSENVVCLLLGFIFGCACTMAAIMILIRTFGPKRPKT
jgi:hypothetical protein